jgi:hypothetical protein
MVNDSPQDGGDKFMKNMERFRTIAVSKSSAPPTIYPTSCNRSHWTSKSWSWVVCWDPFAARLLRAA